MRKTLSTLIAALAAGSVATAAAQTPYPKVRVQTSQGVFVLQLDGARAPISVHNFLEYMRAGHYDGTIFHRVIDGFVVQGGGFTPDLKEKPTRDPIPNESGNGLSNVRGTIAMARTEDPHSATSQFYINLKDNVEARSESRALGYCVFGKVIEGMEVIDAIAKLPTGARGEMDRTCRRPTSSSRRWSSCNSRRDDALHL
jgi:peptidyl-prolyl cis-trans isomerase A (cyclophilin A)